MTRQWPIVLLALLAAGCGGGYVGRNEPPAPDVCAREADNDPQVRELTMKMAGSSWIQNNDQNEMIVLRREALLRCMRQRGLIQKGGGVEPTKPVWYDPGNTGF